MRHMADMEALHTYEGTETIQTLIVGRDITGVECVRVTAVFPAMRRTATSSSSRSAKLAQVEAGSFGDPLEPVVRRVHVHMELRGSDLGIEIVGDVLHQRLNEDAVTSLVLLDELPELGPDQPVGRAVLTEHHVIHDRQRRQRLDARLAGERLAGDHRLPVCLGNCGQANMDRARPDDQVNAEPAHAPVGALESVEDGGAVSAHRDHRDDLFLPDDGQTTLVRAHGGAHGRQRGPQALPGAQRCGRYRQDDENRCALGSSPHSPARARFGWPWISRPATRYSTRSRRTRSPSASSSCCRREVGGRGHRATHLDHLHEVGCCFDGHLPRLGFGRCRLHNGLPQRHLTDPERAKEVREPDALAPPLGRLLDSHREVFGLRWSPLVHCCRGPARRRSLHARPRLHAGSGRGWPGTPAPDRRTARPRSPRSRPGPAEPARGHERPARRPPPQTSPALVVEPQPGSTEFVCGSS